MSDAREARYAEAIRATLYPINGVHHQRYARAVMAVADEEQAALRAEVERLRDDVRTFHLQRDVAVNGRRGAEDRLRKVAELADEWEAERDFSAGNGIKGSTFAAGEVLGFAARDIRAVLAAPPAAPEAAELNCPVCGSGEEGCCVCQQMRRAEDAEAEVERWKAKYREEWTRAETATRNLAESVPVYRGWRGYSDGSRTDVERWVKAADGDWVSLDSERRTDGDIILEHWSSTPAPVSSGEAGTGEAGGRSE